MASELWQECLGYLEHELPSQQFNTWIRPLQGKSSKTEIMLYAPNRFVLDWVNEKYLTRIKEVLDQIKNGDEVPKVVLKIGTIKEEKTPKVKEIKKDVERKEEVREKIVERKVNVEGAIKHESGLNAAFTFDTFVEGKSNQLALAAASQVADNPGAAYNPLFLYGGVGLGKTHLMHAVGDSIRKKNPNGKNSLSPLGEICS